MKLLPSPLITNSIDAYIDKHPTKSQKIYWVVLFALTAAIISLPLVYVDVSVQDAGIIRPAVEKTEIKASITEFVDSVYTKEGLKISKGDTILTFRSSNANYKINYHKERLRDLQEHINDLKELAKGKRPDIFSSDTRRKEYSYFIKQLEEYKTTLQKSTKDYQRNKALYEKKVIAAEEYEKYQYEYNKINNELASLKDNQISKWQTDLNSYTNSYNEIFSSLNQEIKDKELYVITSPVSGTLDYFRGIYKGSNIQTGNSVAIISPDSTLCCEIYVTPRNIGYIHIGMPVSIQVESFNYNEWGTIEGLVTEISSDFLTDNNNNAFYQVKCKLEKDHLIRKNGVQGKLKKGMTVISHFKITRRSLFDLLYQKMDDWANPTQYNINSITQAL
ncbi:HlyD family efflux transporter periplasmic adaptor subunit [Parabacteroides gordonii]|jgi:multidrug resistance efflux pump|uniref:HlyD family secretion protein n=1 Tax=Parabacteroides gordonii TaxID=574930 RepID=UPI00241F67EA|nr:HlyD family efflux transporter periplasmic adaptor subunit [Parabacteroides gordonii]